VNGGQKSFPIEYSTDEIHSQQIPFSSVAIPFAQDFEGFYPGVDVFMDGTCIRVIGFFSYCVKNKSRGKTFVKMAWLELPEVR